MIFLLLLSVVAASLNSVVLHKAKFTDSGSIYRYNLISSVVWCICLFIAGGGKVHLDANTLLWGCAYGVTQALFIIFKTAAMNSGPVSVTTLIGNCSIIVSVAACFFLWDEPVSLPDIAGLAILMTGLVLTTFKRGGGKFSAKWPLYAALFLVIGAGVGLTFKAFSKSGTGDAGNMMLVASGVMFLFNTAACLFTGAFKSKAERPEKTEIMAFVLPALVSGLFSCVYNRLNIFLSGELIGMIFYPGFNGGVVILSTVLSVVFLREKLSAKQIIGILIGVAGICIIGVF